ncbi:MAG: ORF6N domain-containing protein [Bacteroidales bacterium]|nr:ORF6N domain-containing protein [Bacteroidales bacterium]
MELELKTSEELEIVKTKIYDIDGEKVIFDFDLARLYGIETKVLNQAVKRNLSRFPDDFMIYIDNQKLTNLKSQIVTSSWGGSRKGAYAFTEHGVAMLSSVLRSPVAIQINIMIMRAFVHYRRFGALATSQDSIEQLAISFEELKLDIEDIMKDQNDINENTRARLEIIERTLAALQPTIHNRSNKIGFKQNSNGS